MPRKLEKEPKTERGEEKEEQVRLLTEIYSSMVREGELDDLRKEVEQGLETRYQPLLQESKLSRDQFRFLTNAFAELNRRERIGNLLRDLVTRDTSSIKMSVFSKQLKRLEELIEESEKVEVELTIPGKKESYRLDFGLRLVEEWRSYFAAFERTKNDLDSARSIDENEGRIDFCEREFEEYRKGFKDIDERLKRHIEEFERKKASVSTASKEEIPEEESEGGLSDARKKAEEAFEEGKKE